MRRSNEGVHCALVLLCRRYQQQCSVRACSSSRIRVQIRIRLAKAADLIYTGGDIVTRNDCLQKSFETVKLADLVILDKNPTGGRVAFLGGTQATNAANSPLLTFCAASFDRMPFRYTIVDLMSRCPSHPCTVRMSTPSRR
jgi:hypothetical protein